MTENFLCEDEPYSQALRWGLESFINSTGLQYLSLEGNSGNKMVLAKNIKTIFVSRVLLGKPYKYQNIDMSDSNTSSDIEKVYDFLICNTNFEVNVMEMYNEKGDVLFEISRNQNWNRLLPK